MSGTSRTPEFWIFGKELSKRQSALKVQWLAHQHTLPSRTF
jgi:hypothetical protein